MNFWLTEDLSFLLPKQTQFLFIVIEGQSNYALFSFHWIYLTLHNGFWKKETAKPDETKGLKVKRWMASWADEMRVWRPRPTFVGEVKEKSNLSSFNCCPPLSCLLPCPSQISLWHSQTQSRVFHWAWNTAKPLQGPLSTQTETYSYKEEIFFLLEALQNPSSAPFIFFVCFQCRNSFQKNKGSSEWFNKFWIK